MMPRWGTLLARRAWFVLIAGTSVVVAAAVFGLGVFDSLSNGGFSINGKGFPATQPLVARKGEKVMVRYMNERTIGGKPLAALQGLQWKIADMATQLDAARLLLLRAVPPPVWALVLLFVFLPGVLPGALALGVYTLGVLGALIGTAHPRTTVTMGTCVSSISGITR